MYKLTRLVIFGGLVRFVVFMDLFSMYCGIFG